MGPEVGTAEMQLQPEDDYVTDDQQYDQCEGEEEDDSESCLSELPSVHAPNVTIKLHASSSKYDAETEFRRRKPLHEQLPTGTIFDGCFKITRMVGKGSFGAAFAAEDLRTGREEVVIKARVSTLGCNRFSECLQKELDVYMQLGANEKQTGIPRIYSAGVHKCVPSSSEGRPIMVSYIAMQRLGESVWTYCHKWAEVPGVDDNGNAVMLSKHVQPSRQWVVETGKGMLKALSAIHAKGFVHKDVKTENFCLGADDGSVYAIDYGFTMPAFGCYSFNKYNTSWASFWGTPNYASENALRRFPQTPRDDLEALVYCLLEMCLPDCRLPWNNSLTTNSEAAAGWSDEQLDRMAEMKGQAFTQACQEGIVPCFIQQSFDYIYNLQPWEVPHYDYLLQVLDSGSTHSLHQPPSRQPEYTTYSAWPSVGQRNTDRPIDRAAVTASLLQELRAAASVVLPDAAGQAAQAPAAAAAANAPLQQKSRKRPQQQLEAAAAAPECEWSGSGDEADAEDEYDDVSSAVPIVEVQESAPLLPAWQHKRQRLAEAEAAVEAVADVAVQEEAALEVAVQGGSQQIEE